MEPEISIVLPTYNGARFIRESIESSLNQTFQNFELIIVNDCSTDNTPLIIEEYAQKDTRVKVINNGFNKKLPQSLNAGFGLAKGTYFTWTSDDNKYASTALEVMLATLKKNSESDLVYCDYTLINENGEIKGIRKFGDVNKSFNNWLGCGACFLYKKEIHQANNGYNPSAFLIEDYDFFVRAYLKYQFIYLPDERLYFYREHGASLTATQSASINDISKIFLERNLAGLVNKLPCNEIELLYRKFAVYYAFYKNNSEKYIEYLKKLRQISLSKTIVTVFYVLFKKLMFALYIGLTGIAHLPKLMMKRF
jgi:glycosyltransferase involved in cell wall biosynthesis